MKCVEVGSLAGAGAGVVGEVDAVGGGEWWWEMVEEMRENAAVIFANVCGHLDLSAMPEEICLPILDGLLHWTVCTGGGATDRGGVPLQFLALESMCKLCVVESNVDLVVATPPFGRIVLLLTNLVSMVGDRRLPVVREFAVGLLSCLVPSDPSAARAFALQRSAVSFLLEFIEEAEIVVVAAPPPAPPAATPGAGGRGGAKRGDPGCSGGGGSVGGGGDQSGHGVPGGGDTETSDGRAGERSSDTAA